MKSFWKIMMVVVAMLVLVACTETEESQTESDSLREENSSTEEETENNTEVDTDDDTDDDTIDNGDTSGEGVICWVSGSTVNLRTTPSTSGEIIAKLAKGTEIEKIAEEGEWMHIRYGEVTGYIHGDYVSAYKPYNPENGRVSIVVKKSERKLELWQGGALVDTFPIGLGWAPEGHKQVEGDGRTPEGEYYVCVRNHNSSFYLSLGVSYPNIADAEAALADGRINRATYERIKSAIENGQRPDWNTALGGAIMIHGHGSGSDWTAGCIAVENEIMDLLFDYCALGTKITILP